MASDRKVARRMSRYRSADAQRAYLAVYDAALGSYWPSTRSLVDAPTEFGPTRIIKTGATHGTPIVLLHGIAVSAVSWSANVVPLGESHPVIAIDTVSDAGRSNLTQPVRDGAAMARWLDEVLAALDIADAHLVGLSYGAWLVLNQAVRSPHRIRSITAIDPPGAIVRMKLNPKMLPDIVKATVVRARRRC